MAWIYFEAELALGNFDSSPFSPLIGGSGGRLCNIIFTQNIQINTQQIFLHVYFCTINNTVSAQTNLYISNKNILV